MTDQASAPWRPVLRGYVSHRQFGGFLMPATVQNLVMRDYTQRVGAVFKLSVDEHAFADCYMRLYGILDDLDGVDGVVMCSAFMLPKNPKRRAFVYDRVASRKAALHFVFENIVVRGIEDSARLEEIFGLSGVLDRCPKTIPAGLMPPIEGNDTFS